MASFLEIRKPHAERLVRSADCSPAVSRSGSISSTVSEPRGGSLQSLGTRSSSASDLSLTEKKPKGSGNWTSRLSEEYNRRKQAKEQKRAEEKERNERLKKEILKVMTSRHAAQVRAKLNGGDGNGNGIQPPAGINHMSAAQLQMRFPHSGPPAVRGGHKEKVRKHANADMPSLTRIISGDEVDDEEERMKQHRDAWKRSTRPDARMRQLSEGHTPPSEEEDGAAAAAVTNLMESTTLGNDDALDSEILALDEDKFKPKLYNRKSGYNGYKRDERGVWTKDKENPYSVHKS